VSASFAEIRVDSTLKHSLCDGHLGRAYAQVQNEASSVTSNPLFDESRKSKVQYPSKQTIGTSHRGRQAQAGAPSAASVSTTFHRAQGALEMTERR
jgi:hypothetical protein